MGLVAAMHPTVMMLWTGLGTAPEPYTGAWTEQRSRIFQSALDGHFWGTIASEPGSGRSCQDQDHCRTERRDRTFLPTGTETLRVRF